MRRSAFFFLALCVSMSIACRADEWSKTFTISNQPDLHVETSDANIRVDTWDQNKIEARVTTSGEKIGNGGIQITDQQNGDSVTIIVRFPHHHFAINWHSRVDVDIHMPRQGRSYLATGDGEIRLSNFKGDMELKSGDGNEEISGVDGSLRAHTGDGRIDASGRFDGVDISTSDGRIDARVLSGSAVKQSWSFRTGDGSVMVQIPEDLAADVVLRTGDGDIDTDLPLSVNGPIKGNDVRGKLNGGGNLLSVHTGDGSIRLEKALR